jgi:prolipoprotein diacylglyceryltransferase
MAIVSDLGKSTFKVNSAIDSLAKTDDMLAIIGFIMLLGVIVSAYGSWWQGNLARKQYNEECKPNVAPNKNDTPRTILYMILAAVFGALIIYFIFKLKDKKTPTISSPLLLA